MIGQNVELDVCTFGQKDLKKRMMTTVDNFFLKNTKMLVFLKNDKWDKYSI